MTITAREGQIPQYPRPNAPCINQTAVLDCPSGYLTPERVRQDNCGCVLQLMRVHQEAPEHMHTATFHSLQGLFQSQATTRAQAARLDRMKTQGLYTCGRC
jgi:hypothetical protein